MARIVVGFQYDLSNRNQSSYVTIKNCTFYGGTTIPASTDNLEGLRIEESNNTTIQNCTFYSYTNSTGSHNTSAIKVYDSNYITVTNCVIYDSLVGIFYKRAADYVTTTNNFFHDMDQDGVLLTQSTGVNMTDHIFNNNLFINCGTAGIQLSGQDGNYLTNLTVYNNTFYNTTYGVDDHSATTVNHRYYNNISQSNSWAFAYPPPAGLLECDYNNNGSTSFTILYNSTYRQGGTSVSSFTNWKATTAVNGGNPDTHGYTSNPVFRNTSGNLNTIADFEPTSSDCIGKGKGGANIGADVSLVGTGSTGGSTPTAPTSVPTIGIGGFRTW